uniref:Uncharacterized protein n=1 Tax=Nelumbo nucifera TaxID=4432 RepID=A0A822XZ14_NELNU|nr:TPA_asm: hypothetical protein HUJ06_026427 [Nelumbo nucifera]
MGPLFLQSSVDTLPNLSSLIRRSDAQVISLLFIAFLLIIWS